MEDIEATEGYLIAPVEGTYPLTEKVHVISLPAFIARHGMFKH
jgi:hypothetical protein